MKVRNSCIIPACFLIKRSVMGDQGRSRWLQQRPRTTDKGRHGGTRLTEAPQQGPRRRRPLRKFDRGIGDRWDNESNAKFDRGIGDRWDDESTAPPSLARARTSMGRGALGQGINPDLHGLDFAKSKISKFQHAKTKTNPAKVFRLTGLYTIKRTFYQFQLAKTLKKRCKNWSKSVLFKRLQKIRIFSTSKKYGFFSRSIDWKLLKHLAVYNTL